MKKLFFSFALILTFFVPSLIRAEISGEQIDNFNIEININQDSGLDVSERIVYNFGDVQRHGIYRDIPYKYQARGGNYNLRISDFAVVDENGQAYNFEISNSGDDKRIKIGDADKYVSGVKTYIITYKIKRAINYFDDYDELYWNAIGNAWGVPIYNARVAVNFPNDLSEAEIKAACFAGVYGSNAACLAESYKTGESDKFSGAVFGQDYLDPGEGMTVVIGLPKGQIYEPSVLENFLEILKDNWILFLPIIVFFAMFFYWKKKGKDPRGRGTIIAEFDAPDNLTPPEVGTLIDERADNKDVSAGIVNLAVKGYLKINYLEDSGFLFNNSDYVLTRLKEPDSNLNDWEKKLLKKLFKKDYIDDSVRNLKSQLEKNNSKKDSLAFKIIENLISEHEDNKKAIIKLADLKESFYKDLAVLKEDLYKDLVAKEYFAANPQKVRTAWVALGVLIIFGGFFMAGFFGIIGLVSFIISGVIVIVFGIFMPKRTEEGVLAREHILGLREYLQVAESDRIKFHNAPEKKPEVFEKFLPYAMVLGVEKEWARQFEDIYKANPDWYENSTGAHFTALALANNLGNFQTSANSAMATAPSSASGGGSGFSGGGSGGGFGGGGGGSW